MCMVHSSGNGGLYSILEFGFNSCFVHFNFSTKSTIKNAQCMCWTRVPNIKSKYIYTKEIAPSNNYFWLHHWCRLAKNCASLILWGQIRSWVSLTYQMILNLHEWSTLHKLTIQRSNLKSTYKVKRYRKM